MGDQEINGEELTKMKLGDLKRLCKKYNLPTSGTKVELISRLVENKSESFTILQPGDEDKLLGEVDDDVSGSFAVVSNPPHPLGSLEKKDDTVGSADKPTVPSVLPSTVSRGIKRSAAMAELESASLAKVPATLPSDAQTSVDKTETPAPVVQVDKIAARAERFGLSRPPATFSDDKLAARARRFGLPIGGENGGTSTSRLRVAPASNQSLVEDADAEKRRKRAQRFGIPDLTSAAEAERKARRLERFGASLSPPAESLKAARALKFGIQTDEEKLLKRKSRFGVV